MKQWQNFNAFSKVKTSVESLMHEVSSVLESCLDEQQGATLSSDQLTVCAQNFAQIAGVLRMMEYIELALLVDEIRGLLLDSSSEDASLDETRRTEIRELIFVAVTDLPALLEGVLSGQIQHWHEYSQLFNRIRKARNKSLVFASSSLLTNPDVEFSTLFSRNPAHMKRVIDQLHTNYAATKKMILKRKAVSHGITALGSIFSSLEIVSRDYRLGTLWGLCLALLESLREEDRNADSENIKLLCSFGTVIQTVRDNGIRALQQNIPEEILGKVLDALSGPLTDTNRLLAVRHWFNLDLRMSKEQRSKYQNLLVAYSRKEAFIKAIKLLTENISLLSEQINDDIANAEVGMDKLLDYTGSLDNIRASIAALGMDQEAGALQACILECPGQGEDAQSELSPEVRSEFLSQCARTLYQSEMSIAGMAEALERAVFVSTAGHESSSALTGARLSVVLEAIRNLEQVVITINTYVEEGCKPEKLADAARQLEGAEVALNTVSLEKAVRYCAGARQFVNQITQHGKVVNISQEGVVDDTIHAFAHLVINTIMYLEQVTIGREDSLQHIVSETDRFLDDLETAAARLAQKKPQVEHIQAGEVADAHEVAAGPATEDGQAQEQATPPVTRDNVVMTIVPPIVGNKAVNEIEADDEIREIFIEEAEEILPEIVKGLSRLSEEPDDAEALSDLRRNYHTLKGSGRMVAAEAIAALAWSLENLLNTVISGSIEADAVLHDLLSEVSAELPVLLEDFRAGKSEALDVACVSEAVSRIDSFMKPAMPLEPEVSIETETVSEVEVAPEIEIQAAGTEIDTETVTVTLTEDEAETVEEADADMDEDTEEEAITAEDVSENLHEVFVLETDRQVGRIQQFLQNTFGLDADEQLITTTSFLIPVHTLYGNCTYPQLQPFARVVGQLERLLQSYPHRRPTQGLEDLLKEFCNIANRVASCVKEQDEVELTGEICAALEVFEHSLESARRELEGDDSEQGEQQQERTLQPETSQSSAEALDYDALLVEGFLQEARSIDAFIRLLFNEFVESDKFSRTTATRLQDQCSLFEGAASLIAREDLSAVSHSLSLAYQQYADGLYIMNDTIRQLLSKGHDYISECIRSMEKAEPEEVSLPPSLQQDLLAEIERQIKVKSSDEIRVAEAEVEESLLAVFIEEATEILQELDSRIADWQQAPDDADIVDDLLRSLHTLKGSAALVGETSLSESAHRFETLIIGVRQNTAACDKAFFTQVERQLNILQMLFALYRQDESGRIVKTPISEEELEKITRLDEPAENASDQPQSENSDNKVIAIRKTAMEPKVTPVATNTAIDEHVRVSGNLLKSLLNDADEISIARNRVEQNVEDFNVLMTDMDETLGRLEGYIHSFEAHSKNTMVNIARGDADREGEPSGTGDSTSTEAQQQSDFDALEMDRYTELQQIALSLLEDYDDLRDIKRSLAAKLNTVDGILSDQQRSTNRLQEGLISSQMVPFAGIVPRLRRLTRQVSNELEKDVTITFSNPEGKIDRSILQAIVGPIEHMIRNAIDHGVESAIEREKQGKPQQSELQVKLFRQGANIILEITDDGRGINTRKVREKGIAEGLLQEDEKISDQELCQLILRAGFSTSDKVSRISGRGVGLDVVQDEISQIGGDVEILSREGQGTTFRIRLPLTSSLNRALLFKVRGVEYVMLLNTIDGIILERHANLERYYAQGKPAVYEYANKSYELAWLGTLLGDQQLPELRKEKDASASLLLVSGTHRNLALQVDSVVGSRELVVKSLGSQFAAIPALAGGVILGDGRVVIVLDPRSLIDSFGDKERTLFGHGNDTPGTDAGTSEAGPGKTILVVDDSITVRKVTSAILKRNGMNVLLARNGMEAVEILQTARPDVMLLDIEMPKMDGFEVAAYIRRQNNEVRNMPIIMITSRIGDKHRNRAEEIGVNEYMCKPFQEESLLDAIAGFN